MALISHFKNLFLRVASAAGLQDYYPWSWGNYHGTNRRLWYLPNSCKVVRVLTSKCSHQFLPVLALEVKSPMFGCNSPKMGDKKNDFNIAVITFSVGG